MPDVSGGVVVMEHIHFLVTLAIVMMLVMLVAHRRTCSICSNMLVVLLVNSSMNILML